MQFEKDDIPPGFGMLLGRNENAMKCFSGMTDTEKEDVIRQAQAARSTDDIAREFDTLKCKKVPQSLEIGLFFCQIFIFII